MQYDHEDFRKRLMPLIAKNLKLTGAPTFPEQMFWGFTGDAATFDPSNLRESLKDRLHAVTVACRRIDSHKARMLRALRAALIAADAAGSGLPRTGRHTEWIREHFDQMPQCTDRFIQDIVLKRIGDLASAGNWSEAVTWDSAGWNAFQKGCDELPSRAVLLAPCGAGKTLAAWRWIARRVQDTAAKRVLFLYPTRATATEGFKDYVSWAPEADLVHGTARYDLDGMFPVEDPRSGRTFETDPRLFALQHWPKRVFSATVDQFLGFMSYGYGPMCLLPLLAESVIVVDEVHSFDRKMFSALLGFLSVFDVPVLAMTATLPKPRQLQLINAGLYLSNPKPDDLTRAAGAPRYRVSRIDEGDAIKRIREAVQAKKRVLWVVNQVSRAQAVTEKLADNFMPGDMEQSSLKSFRDVRLLCYHSRFTLNDRLRRHRELLGAVRAGEPEAIAVTTQVCEMSLDIDADVLITEACPITSIVQRMGRCRRGRKELASKGPGDVLVYRPAEENVYKSDDLVGLEEFLTFITRKKSVSQTDLEDGLEQYGPNDTEAPRLNSFLASGAYAIGSDDSFREIEEFNVSAIVSRDLSLYQSAGPTERLGYVLPVPKKLHPAADSRLPRYLRVADDRHYHRATGFWDKPLR
jgi:CRISPR-associated endonuclease/helicase Cas3